MQYSLRNLLIVATLGPPLLAGFVYLLARELDILIGLVLLLGFAFVCHRVAKRIAAL